VSFDADRDGDLDLVATFTSDGRGSNVDHIALYQNQLDVGTDDRHYLVIRPRMEGPNTQALGARVAVEVSGRTQTRWITTGTSYLGQEPAEAFFGLGAATIVERVTIVWPGTSPGGETVLLDVPADQIRTVWRDGIFLDGFESGDTSSWSESAGFTPPP
jgi:hypothetical protein